METKPSLIDKENEPPARLEKVKSWENVLGIGAVKSEPQSDNIIMKLKMVKMYRSTKEKELVALMLKL